MPSDHYGDPMRDGDFLPGWLCYGLVLVLAFLVTAFGFAAMGLFFDE